MEHFAKLPEGCISEIVSFTSPADASALSVISKCFKSATESDTVWKKFLPSDIDEIVSKSPAPFDLPPTKKELYMFLSHSHILLAGGKLGFSLDKRTGKKCFRVAGSELVFTQRNHSNSMYTEPELLCSRHSDFAVIKSDGSEFDVFGRISSEKLSEKTHYSSYLVFMPSAESASIALSFWGVCRFADNEDRVVPERRVRFYNFRVPVVRDDGWLEVEIGTFFNAGGNRGDVESCLLSVFIGCGRFLIVRRLEFRPYRARA